MLDQNKIVTDFKNGRTIGEISNGIKKSYWFVRYVLSMHISNEEIDQAIKTGRSRRSYLRKKEVKHEKSYDEILVNKGLSREYDPMCCEQFYKPSLQQQWQTKILNRIKKPNNNQ